MFPRVVSREFIRGDAVSDLTGFEKSAAIVALPAVPFDSFMPVL